MRQTVILFFFFVFACRLSAGAVVPVWKDIVYKEIDGRSLKLDIYLPPTGILPETRCPVVIYIHGGSWITGSKEAFVIPYMDEVLCSVLDEGYAVVSIEYLLADTLGKTPSFPEAVIDCKDAVRWVRAHASEYGLDSARIGLWGSSAGAHLSLLCAYTPDTLFMGDTLLADFSADVDYVIDDYGPADLNKLFRTRLGPVLLGCVKLFAPSLYKEREMMLSVFLGTERNRRQIKTVCEYYSPTTYVGRESVPTLLLHGDKDKVVPLKQSRKLAKMLEKHKIVHRLVIYPDAGHSFRTFTRQDIDNIRDNILDFLHLYSHKNH